MAARGAREGPYPTCCPLVRFSHIRDGSIEDAARDGPCAHGKKGPGQGKFVTMPDVAWCCRLTTYRHRFARAAPAPRRIVDVHRPSISPNQVLTHAARAAAKQLNFQLTGDARLEFLRAWNENGARGPVGYQPTKFSGTFGGRAQRGSLSAFCQFAKSKSTLPGCVVKPARLHFARTARALRDATLRSEASCPNFEPRAHARLTGLTTGCAAPFYV